MKKELLVLVFFLFFLNQISADSLTGLTISAFPRLNEKVAITGTYNSDVNAFVLCKFVVWDLNSAYVDRWSDEYTFSDGSFYAEKVVTSPPYFVGDYFYLTVSCGTVSNGIGFTIDQPLGLSHPVQMGWEYFFSEKNLDAIMFLLTFLALPIIIIFVIIFLIKKGGFYAR